jgi:sporulation protein YlmC with PRC-barrel domain
MRSYITLTGGFYDVWEVFLRICQAAIVDSDVVEDEMARYGQIKGLSVITLQEGKKIGSVDDLILDPDRRQVRWLRLQGAALFGEKSYVPAEAVRGIGKDAITVRSEADVKKGKDMPEMRDQGDRKRLVSGNRVLSEDGKLLGTVSDYEFAPDSFALTGLVLNQGSPLSPHEITIAADRVKTIGPDVIIVADEAAGEVARAAAQKESEERADREAGGRYTEDEPRSRYAGEQPPVPADERTPASYPDDEPPVHYAGEEPATPGERTPASYADDQADLRPPDETGR